MLDTYDMQMLDYSGDHDVQMHPSSSDQWFQDEAKMEEDGPPLLKHESDAQLKTDGYTEEKIDLTIEVDMEPTLDPHNAEYDMLEDEETQGAEILDVEVYDASHIQSPAMFAIDLAQGENFTQHFETPNLGSTPNVTVSDVPIASLNPPLELSDTHALVDDEIPSTAEAIVQPHIYEPEFEEQLDIDSSEPVADLANVGVDPSPESPAIESHEASTENEEHHIHDGDGEGSAVEPAAVEPEQTLESEVDGTLTQMPSDNDAHDSAVATDVQDATKTSLIPSDNASSGDPHEISEGVYIDPPPPVLLSVGSEEGFNFSFFNEPSSWNEGSQKDTEVKPPPHVLLHHLPTLYYEPLSTVFDAVREEEFIRSLFPTAETELVLEAVDLRLTLSEDNVYAREVTLHDLNVLHDVSGINGLLRMRLSTTSPRFITRYQQLQDEVSRLDLGLQGEELPVETEAGDLLSHEEHHEASVPSKEDEAAQDQTPYEQDEQLTHDTEGQTTENVEEEAQKDGGSFDQEHDHQYYEGQERVSELALTLQEHPEEFGADDESALNEQLATEEASIDLPLLIQADSLSTKYLKEPKETNEESPTTTHHSTPTSGSRDVGASAHEYEDAGVIALEMAEANSHDDIEYAQGGHSFDGEGEGEEDLQYTEYDGEEDQEEYEEEHQEEDQGGQHQDELYQEEANEQQPDQREQQEAQSDQPEDHPHTRSTEEAADTLLSATRDAQIISGDAPEPENESIYEQASTLGEGTNFGEEGEYVNDVDATFDHSATTELTEELTHVEETEQTIHVTADSLEPHPEIPEFIEEEWEEDLDGEGEIDDNWDEDNEVQTAQSNSNHSSVTLSSKASKRSFDELESDGDGDVDGNNLHWTPPGSPGPKRSRTH